MPIEVHCSSCQRTFRVPDNVAGKKIKCPKCAGILSVPGPAQNTAAADAWHVKTADGQEYGPVSKADLDEWMAEGRLDADCQVLLAGAPQWQWASDLYPQLAAPAPAAAPTPAFPNFAAASPGSSNIHGAAAASPSGPFDFAAADSSSTSRLGGKSSVSRSTGRTAKGRRPKSGAVTAVAVVNFILGALQLMCGLLLVLGGGMIANFVDAAALDLPEESAQQGAALAGTIGAIVVVFGIVSLSFGLLVIVAGFGVLQRAQWGRILTLILGALAGVLAVLNLLSIFTGNIGGIVGVLLDGGYCGMVFAILLNKQHAAEFR